MSDEVPMQEQQKPHDSVEEPNEMETTSQQGIGEPTNDQGAPSNDESNAVKSRMEEMEKEAAKLRELHSQLSKDSNNDPSEEERRDIDSRSVYIGNVDYGSTPLELQQHFSSGGVVNRVTIPLNKFTGQPKGFAYLEFADIDGVNKAVATLDGSTFRDRELKVCAKRTNVPGMSSTNRGGGFPRGGGFRGRGGFRGGFRGRGPRGGRGGFRGGSRFTPY